MNNDQGSKTTVVLIVDDDSDTQRMARRIAERYGYAVEAAANGQEALERYRAGGVDVIVTDLDMPVLSGHALVRMLRQTDKHIPIVVMSGVGEMDDLVELVRLRISDYVQKPFRPADFARAIAEALAQRPESAPPPPTGAAAGESASASAPSADRSAEVEARYGAQLKQLDVSKLRLPTSHALLDELMQIRQQPLLAAVPLKRIIERSPAIAGRVVATANTAFFRGNRQVRNVHEAMVRLGNKQILCIAEAVVLRELFRADHPQIQTALNRLWRRTLFVGGLAREAGRRHFAGEAEDAYLAALLHDVGEVALLRGIDEQLRAENTTDVDLAALGRAIHARHERVGTSLLEAWQVPIFCVNVAGCHHRSSPGPSAPRLAALDLQLVHLLNVCQYETDVRGLDSPLGAHTGISAEESHAVVRATPADLTAWADRVEAMGRDA